MSNKVRTESPDDTRRRNKRNRVVKLDNRKYPKTKPKVSRVDEIFSRVRGFTQHSDLSIPYMGRCTIKNEGNREARVQIEVIVPDTPKLRLRKQKSFSFRKFGNEGAFARAQMLRSFVRIMKRLPLPHEEDYMFRAEGEDEDLESRLRDFITELVDRGEIEGFDINKFLHDSEDQHLVNLQKSSSIIAESVENPELLYAMTADDEDLSVVRDQPVCQEYDPYETYEIPSEYDKKFRDTFKPVIAFLDAPTTLSFGATSKLAHALIYNSEDPQFHSLYSEYQIHRNDLSPFLNAYKILTGVPLFDPVRQAGNFERID